MNQKQFLEALAENNQRAVIKLSPGPTRVSVGTSDTMAAKLLLWLHEQMPEDATSQDLHDVLDAAKWWQTFSDAVLYAEAETPGNFGGSDECTG